MVDHLIPGRNADARQPTEKELRSTMLLRLPMTEASAKVRTGWPNDEDADLALPIWAGVVPFRTVYDLPQPAPDLAFPSAPPSYLDPFARP